MKLPFAALLLFLCGMTTAQPRFTDSTFGTNGKVVENTSVPTVNMIDALLQPDGKTLTLAASEYNGRSRTVLIRYNTDGTADTSFSSNGIADSLIIPGMSCYPSAMRLQPDGKVLVCGFASGDSVVKSFVMRYNASGSLDASFSSAGVFYVPTFTISGTSFDLPGVNNAAILPNGKIMLLCTRSYPNTDFAMIRLNSNGTIDAGFGTNGVAIANPLSNISESKSPSYTHIELLASGKYIVGGNPGLSYAVTGAMVARINADGTVDNTFGTTGYILPVGGVVYDVLWDMIVQPDGKTLITGPQNASGRLTYTSVLRITAAGTVDATFGNNGRSVIYTTSGFASQKTQLNLQTDGKILIGGIAKNSSGNYTMSVARLTTTGVLDATFDGDGIALLQVNGYNSFGRVALQQTDGNITVAGYARSNNARSVTIGRFTATGQTDATLNAAANVTLLNAGTGEEESYNVLVQPADQKIVSVKDRDNGYGSDFCVTRYLPNGRPDTGFGVNGRAYLDLPGYFYQYYSGLSSDGKITVMPDFADYIIGGSLAALRFTATGQPDSSFGGYGKRIFKSRNTDTIRNFLWNAAVQPDGKILMSVGQSEGNPGQYTGRDSSFLIRLNNDGSYDNTFSSTGRKFLAASSGSNTRIVVQPDGKILLAALVSGANNTYQWVVKRLTANGNTDITFNNGTDKIINGQGSQITLQPDGKILLTTYQNTVIRLLSNGNYDSTFGNNGVLNAADKYPLSSGRYISNIKADSNRIVLMGNTYNDAATEIVIKIVALKRNGLIDSTFGQAGVAFPEISTYPYAYEGLRMALQMDGKVLVTGFTDGVSNSNLSDFALTRLKANNSIGRRYTFTGNGLWSNPTNWADGTVPPTTIPAGSSIVIDPPATGECVIDITVHVQTGASVTIKAGKKVRLPGNLIIQ